jgi:hypothetical protein
MGKEAVVWRSTYERTKLRFIVAVVLVNLFWMGAWYGSYSLKYKPLLTELSQVFSTESEKFLTISSLKVAVHEYKIRQDIMKLLRAKGMSLGQGMDIADGIVTECKVNNLPIELVMSLINNESEFYVNAKSPKGALGIMQIMPATWNDMVQKLNLNVGIQAAYDPRMNIKVGCAKLRELWDLYGGDHKRIFSAYNAGEAGGAQPAYVSKVVKGSKQFVQFRSPLDPSENMGALR